MESRQLIIGLPGIFPPHNHRCVDADLEGVEVLMVNAAGQHLGSWQPERFENGMGPIEAGEVLVQVSAGGNRWSLTPLMDPVWLTLHPGENHASVTLASARTTAP